MRRLLWVVLVLGLAATLFLATRDDALRPDVAAAIELRPESVPRDRNLFFGLLGAASQGSEPVLQRGQALWMRYEAAEPAPDRRMIDPSNQLHFKGDANLLCDLHGEPEHPSCTQKLRAHAAEVRSLVDGNAAMIDGYEQLRAFPEFQNLAPYRFDSEILPWQSMLQGRKLQLENLVSETPESDLYPIVRDWLADMTFWRRFFGQANDLLIDKMVGTAGVKGNFILAGELLRQARLSPLQIAQIETAMAPFEASSLSLKPAIAGESRIQAQAVESLRDAGLNELVDLKHPLPEWLSHGLARLLFLPNATINSQHDALFEGIAARDGTHCAAPPAVKQAGDDRLSLRGRVRNPIGNMLAGSFGPSMDPYVDRLCDLEGLRRLVIVHARARAAGLDPEQVPAFLASTPVELHDPYTGAPLAWDAKAAGFRFSARDKRTQYVLPWKL